jgi:hypothetical protein
MDMLFDACGKTGLPALGDAGIRMSRKRWRIVAQHVLDGCDGPIVQRRLALFHVTRALPGFEGVANQLREVLSRDRGLGSKLTFSSIHGCKLLVSVRVSASSCSNDIRQLSIMRRFAVHAHEMLNTAERQISCVCVCVCTHHRGCFTHSPRSWRAGQLQWMMKGGSHAHRYRCRVAVLVTGNRSLVWCLLHVLMLHEHVPSSVLGCIPEAGGRQSVGRGGCEWGAWAERSLLTGATAATGRNWSFSIASLVASRSGAPSLRPQSAHVAL